MDPTVCLALHHLRRAVMAARTTGRTVIEFADGADCQTAAEARRVADGMVALVNLPQLGPHWVATDRPRATRILTAVLHWDLETFTPLVPEADAAALVGRVFNHFPDEATFLTSVRPHADPARSPHRWANGSDLDELDAGVAVVSPALVGLVWVEDRPRRGGDDAAQPPGDRPPRRPLNGAVGGDRPAVRRLRLTARGTATWSVPWPTAAGRGRAPSGRAVAGRAAGGGRPARRRRRGRRRHS